MIRLRGAGSRTVAGSIAAVAAVTLLVSACSGGEQSTPSPTGFSNGSSSPAALRDQSATVLGWTPPAPVAKTEGKLAAHVGQGPNVAATAEIISVQTSDTSTILIWQLSSASDIPLQGVTLNSIQGARFWPDAVRLIDPVGKKSYAVNSMVVGTYTYCVCSDYPIHVGPIPVRMTSEYPVLPATATTISVQIPNFASVTVPVTRS